MLSIYFDNISNIIRHLFERLIMKTVIIYKLYYMSGDPIRNVA